MSDPEMASTNTAAPTAFTSTSVSPTNTPLLSSSTGLSSTSTSAGTTSSVEVTSSVSSAEATMPPDSGNSTSENNTTNNPIQVNGAASARAYLAIGPFMPILKSILPFIYAADRSKSPKTRMSLDLQSLPHGQPHDRHDDHRARNSDQGNYGFSEALDELARALPAYTVINTIPTLLVVSAIILGHLL